MPEKLRRVPVLDDAAAARLAQLGVQIENLYGKLMDVEWALAEGHFSIVQARPITALPKPEPLLPDEWKLPDGAYIAMRNNIVELMADPLSPLFATLGRRAINTSMGRLLAAFFGRPGIMPDEIIIVVNGYAYYNGSLAAGQIVRILLGSVGITRRMFTGTVARWTDVGRPRYVDTVQSWQTRPWRQLPAPEILAAVRELTEAPICSRSAIPSTISTSPAPSRPITRSHSWRRANIIYAAVAPTRTRASRPRPRDAKRPPGACNRSSGACA